MDFLTLAELAAAVASDRWQGSVTLSSQSADQVPPLADILVEQRRRVAAVRHGDKVLLQCGPNLASAAAFLALWEKGAVIVPVSAKDLKAEARLAIATDCNARYDYDPEAPAPAALPTYAAETGTFRYLTDPKVSGSDLALIIYTSGSTGRPKGIVLTHNNVIAALRAIGKYLELGAGERILCLSPLSFDYGLYQLLFAFAYGCHTVLFDEVMQPLQLVKVLAERKINILPIVPVIGASLEKTLKVLKRPLPDLAKITNTGGHLAEPVVRGLKTSLPRVRIYCMYGLTESKRALYLPPEDLERKPGSVGIPMPGLEAKIFVDGDEHGRLIHREAEPGETGELHVRGASVMQGYYAPDAGAGARLLPGRYRDDNWLATGDLFARDTDGYFYFKGRSKDLIKQGAYCLYPKDLEDLVLRCELIEMAAVVGRLDAEGLEVAWLHVKPTEDTPANREGIAAWLKANLAAEYRPRGLRFEAAMPVNVNGKVDKKQLLGDR